MAPQKIQGHQWGTGNLSKDTGIHCKTVIALYAYITRLSLYYASKRVSMVHHCALERATLLAAACSGLLHPPTQALCVSVGWFCSLRARALGGLCYPSFVYINLSSLPSASAVLEKVLSLRISFSLLSGALRVVGLGVLVNEVSCPYS